MPILVHAANVLFLCAYAVRDILKLRLMSLGAGLFLLAFHLLLEPPAWGFVAWDVLFAAIQTVQIARLVRERTPVALDPDERLVRGLAFRTLPPREIKRLCAGATFTDAPRGELLVRSGEQPSHLTLVLKGDVSVEAAGRTVATLGAGQFVGEMSFLTGGEATADARAGDEVRLARFPRAALDAWMRAAPELRAQLQSVLGRDLVEKLRDRGRSGPVTSAE